MDVTDSTSHPAATGSDRTDGRFLAVNRALRTYQWVKNVLLFVPMLMAHSLGDASLWLQATLGFSAFSLAASFGYVVNDLADRDADRQHPTKRYRPFASGALAPAFGYALAPALLVAAFAIAWIALPPPFLLTLGAYLVTTVAYSFALKQQPVTDVVVLAGLYTLRILAGGAATGIVVSEWLLAFSMFFFLSLALLKRFAELKRLAVEPERSLHGRGYRGEDLSLLRNIGATAGYLSVLVLALYVTSPEVVELYDHPNLLWLVAVLLLHWITRVWLLAGRGAVDDDPILFAAKDKGSYFIGALSAAILLVASL